MHFLSVDVGASGGKAFDISYDGKKIQVAEIYRFPNVPVEINGIDYWDIFEIYKNVLKSLEMILQKNEIESVGIDTWGVDFGLLDDKGFMMGTPMHYRNFYKLNSMQKVLDKLSKKWIFERSPTQFQPFNTIYQIAEMKELGMKAIGCARTLLGIPSLLIYFLTGQKAIEFTFATTTQLYNPNLKDWDDEMIKALDLPDIFPKIVNPSTVAEEVNLFGKKFKVVFPPTHDTGSAFACVSDENAMIISTGTWFLEGILSKNPVKNENVMKYNFANEGCIDEGYRLLSNSTGMWLIEELRRKWKVGYDELIEMARTARPFAGMIDVDSYDLQKPDDMELAIVNESVKLGKRIESRAEIARTAFEGIAMKTKWNLEKLEEVSGRKMKKIRMLGGATRNKLICQFISDATNLPVEAGPIEATAIGNGLSQMIANGVIDLDDISDLVRVSFEIEKYEPENANMWQKTYDEWEKFIDR